MQGLYTYVNELYKKIFFNSSGAYLNEFFQDSIFPDDLNIYEEARAECLSKPGKTVCVDLRRSRIDGSFLDQVGILCP